MNRRGLLKGLCGGVAALCGAGALAGGAKVASPSRKAGAKAVKPRRLPSGPVHPALGDRRTVCGKEFVYVRFAPDGTAFIPDGSLKKPYQTIDAGMDNVKPGGTVYISPGHTEILTQVVRL